MDIFQYKKYIAKKKKINDPSSHVFRISGLTDDQIKRSTLLLAFSLRTKFNYLFFAKPNAFINFFLKVVMTLVLLCHMTSGKTKLFT